MKIIAWNCNMAYRRKVEVIQSYQPDIVVVPECEHPDKLKFSSQTRLPKDIFWYGDNKNKGLGVFSYGDYKLQLLDIHQPGFKTILPLAITKGHLELTLFAIWANNPQDKKFQYVGQIWKAVNYYKGLLENKNVILAGDFNSNSIWDKPRREFNHSNVVKYLEEKGIYSTYHKYHNQKQGNEVHPTWFMYRHSDKPYHLDYCFASANLLEKLQSVEIGNYEQWKQFSDHTPVIVNFDL